KPRIREKYFWDHCNKAIRLKNVTNQFIRLKLMYVIPKNTSAGFDGLKYTHFRYYSSYSNNRPQTKTG
ncbi:7979_t:CDS:1, partial [Gigaspora rosea]